MTERSGEYRYPLVVDMLCKHIHDPAVLKLVDEAFTCGRGSVFAELHKLQNEMADLYAKLPKHRDTGRAFVPEKDDAWYWDVGHECAMPVIEWHIAYAHRCYSTELQCESAEGPR